MKSLSIAAALLLAAPALAQPPSIEIAQAWARATPGPVRTGAVYLTLTDHGGPDSLTGVSTPVAAMATMHETTMDQGVARMRLRDSVALAPNVPVSFTPGALHIMLSGLKQPLKAGDRFPLMLTFAKAPAMTVTVTVLATGAGGPATGDGGMPGMKMP